MNFARYKDKCSFSDIYPVLLEDDTISALVLYKNFQRSWKERQLLNGGNEITDFRDVALGVATTDYTAHYYLGQALKQYINSGTWIDKYPNYPRNFVVIN